MTRRSALATVLVVVLALLAGGVPAADAGGLTLEATSVSLDPASACPPAPDLGLALTPTLDLGLRATGPVEHLEAEVTDLNGALVVARSEPAGVGPVDGVVADVEVPLTYDPGVVQLRVWMGAADPTPTTAVEWSVFYGCEEGELRVGATCVGAYGSCPATAVETQAEIVEVDRGADTVEPGDAIETSIRGCFAVDVGLFVSRDDVTLDAEPGGDEWPAGYSSEYGEPPLTADLDVPADVPVGTELRVWAYCGNDDPVAYLEEWTVTVVAPESEGGAPVPTAPPAQPQPGTPSFTG